MEMTKETVKDFKVKLDGFEGPLDLLLMSIEKRKLPINDVSLASVTDDYIEHIKKQQHFPISQTSHFVLIASILLLIKSKSLLPTLELTDEEEEDIESLELRLKLFKRNKELSTYISEMFGKYVMFEARDAKVSNSIQTFSPPKDINIESLRDGIARVLKRLPKVDLVPKAVIKKVVSIEEMIENLTNRIKKNISISFSEFSNIRKAEKVEIIVGFLAMLELAKQGIINITQEKTFSDITMENDSVGVPRYE